MIEQYGTVVVALTAASIFILIISIWMIGLLIWQTGVHKRQERIERRLRGEIDPTKSKGSRVLRLWHKGQIRTTLVEGGKRSKAALNAIDEMRQTLGWKMPLGTFILGLFGVGAMAFVITLVTTRDPFIASCAVAVVVVVLRIYAGGKAKRAEALFERQFADALGLAARSLRAGHPLLSAFQLIVEETDPPVSDAFAEIVQQQALGRSLEDSISTTAEKSKSPDLKLFAASTVIQIRSGGNVADMMDRLVEVIRDRMRLQRKVRVLTAQTQLSKRILIAVPLVLFAMLYLLHYDYIAPMFETEVGRTLMMISAALLVSGAWLMNRIATLKY